MLVRVTTAAVTEESPTKRLAHAAAEYVRLRRGGGESVYVSEAFADLAAATDAFWADALAGLEEAFEETDDA